MLFSKCNSPVQRQLNNPEGSLGEILQLRPMFIHCADQAVLKRSLLMYLCHEALDKSSLKTFFGSIFVCKVTFSALL